ncbi:MAG: anthranilate synthase component I [Candidatus Zixiibacteriota bacterium]
MKGTEMGKESVISWIKSNGIRNLKIVSQEMPADLETPVSAYMKLRNDGAKILLESVESATVLGRYSFIGMRPDSRIIVDNHKLTIKNGAGEISHQHNKSESPLITIREILSQFSLDNSARQPRLLGGAVGYISYDFVRFFEKIKDETLDDLNLPLAILYLIDTLIVFDHVQRRIKIMSLADESSTELANQKINQIKMKLNAPLNLTGINLPVDQGPEPISNYTERQFCQLVDEVKKHIVAGDVYQQVISQRLHGSTKAHPFMIYRALRMLNPSPYMYFLDFDELKLIGSSPEALVRLESGQATVRPIAGTRPRSDDDRTDRQLGEELINDEKERAEHLMLVDLGRNDLGRCSKIGTVEVTDFMKIERYSHVMHLTSNVIGKLNAGMDQFDLFRATFPAGTVTGAPKIRSMQLIEKMENIRRGPYAGAVGYFSLSGDMDWCINIRTIIMKGEEYFLQSGAGIVADSVPQNEYKETQNKIAALKTAIEIAERGF